MWLVTGCFLAASYVIPIGVVGEQRLWMWDLMVAEAAGILGFWLLVTALSGLVISVVALCAPLRAVAITALASGGIDSVLLLSALVSSEGSRALLNGGGGFASLSGVSALDLLHLVSMAAVCVMLTGNCLTLRYPARRSGQLIGGIGAGIAMTLVLVNMVASIDVLVDFPFATGARTVGIVGNLVAGITLLTAGVLIVVNMARSSVARGLSSLANWFALVGIVAYVVLPPVMVVLLMSPGMANPAVVSLLALRLVCFAASPFIMLGSGLYGLISTTIDGESRR